MSVALGLILCLAAQAQPDAKRAAGQLIDEGNELLDQKQYQAALARYQAAHERYPTPKIFFNMAEAHRELGKLGKAIEFYQRFIAESGVAAGSPLRIQADQAIADLETKLGAINVDGGFLGAEVFVDGEPAGRVPLSRFRVLPGIHQVVIQREGVIAKRTEVEVLAGEEAYVDTSPEPPPPAPPITAVSAPPPEEGSIATEWWFWTLIGGAVVIGVGAAVIATTTGGDDFSLGGDLGVSSTADWRQL